MRRLWLCAALAAFTGCNSITVASDSKEYSKSLADCVRTKKDHPGLLFHETKFFAEGEGHMADIPLSDGEYEVVVMPDFSRELKTSDPDYGVPTLFINAPRKHDVDKSKTVFLIYADNNIDGSVDYVRSYHFPWRILIDDKKYDGQIWQDEFERDVKRLLDFYKK